MPSSAHRTPHRPVQGQRAHTRHSPLMEVASPQHLGDSFSCGWLKCGAQAPSFERLVDADFGGSSRSFIDMDPAELFSMRWTTTTTATPPASDFDFGMPGGGSDPPSPLLVSASQIFRNGRLLPCDDCEPVGRSGVQEHGDGDTVRRVADLPSAPRSSASSPLYHSAQSTPASLSSCSSTRSLAGQRNAKPPPLAAGRRGRASSWKILLRYLRFLMPLYRKVRALRRFAAPPRPRVSPASPPRASTSSVEWCHGNADTAVRDAILYCKKSSGQDL